MNNGVLLLIIFCLTSCTTQKNFSELHFAGVKKSIEDKKNLMINSEPVPTFPDEKENNKSILGLDVNKNGIRDDIENWIAYVGTNEHEKSQLSKIARLIADELDDSNNEKEKICKIQSEIYFTDLCLQKNTNINENVKFYFNGGIIRLYFYKILLNLTLHGSLDREKALRLYKEKLSKANCKKIINHQQGLSLINKCINNEI